MAWAGPETQQISLFLFLLWQEAYFRSGIRIAQGPDEMSVCLCALSPSTASYTSLPSLGMLQQGAIKTTQVRWLLSSQIFFFIWFEL